MNEPPVEVVRVSEVSRLNLIALKKRTGIENWNILCRWGFCLSLADRSPLAPTDRGEMSSVEMTWSTFGGTYADLYAGALKARCVESGIALDKQSYAEQFRLHLERGLLKLVGLEETRSLEGFLGLAVIEV